MACILGELRQTCVSIRKGLLRRAFLGRQKTIQLFFTVVVEYEGIELLRVFAMTGRSASGTLQNVRHH